MTTLYNRVIPLIRYDMRDYVTRGTRAENERFNSIVRVEGRVNDALPIQRNDGSSDTIHPIVLSEFFVPGATKFQFESVFPSLVTIRYIAESDLHDAVRKDFLRLLEMKGAEETTQMHPERVRDLPVDPKTGKYRLVVLPKEGSA